MFKRPNPALLALQAIFVSAFAGCSFDAKYRSMSLHAPAKEVRLEYHCQPGDRITLGFIRGSADSAEAYRLQPGDAVQLSVQDREDLARVASVAPDGKIYFPYIEPFPAAGKTLAELALTAEEKYQPIVRSARVTVVPVRFAGKLDAMTEGLSGPGKGPEYSTTVGLDGNALFPHLGFLKAQGLTPQELNSELGLAYRKIMSGVDVTANVAAGSSRYLTLLGELRHPGSFPVDGTVSLTTALGFAEGWLPSARVQDIVLVQKRDGQVVISKYDLDNDLMAATQIQLVGGDLVFVPRSAITDLNIFVDQYLRRNLPVAVGISVPAELLSIP
ncbi:MAG: polysaccharide biosynthesis/export family protein [Fibrobacteria bacterium]